MKQIPLTQGQYAIVDDADFDLLNQWKWFAQWNPDTKSYYAERRAGNGHGSRTQIYMHRLLLGLNKGDRRLGDHRNRNTLDNTRNNLRIANYSQNRHNSKIRADCTTGFKGVRRSGKKWMACVYTQEGENYLGTFDSKEAAALAYNSAAKELYGEFALLNVIGTKP